MAVDSQQRNRVAMRILGVVVIVLVAMVLTFAIVIWNKAPFSRSSISQRIQRAGLRFQAETFQTTWFPPGFTAGNVRIEDPSQGKPLLIAKRVEVFGSYLGLLRKTTLIPRIRVTGALATVRRSGSKSMPRLDSANSTAVSEMYIEDSALDVLPAGQPSGVLHFAVAQLTLHHLGEGGPVSYSVSMTNPKPHGDIHSTGQLGPWNSRDIFATPVSGAFTFANVDLTVNGGITGVLSSQGKFSGVLRSIKCTGTADVPRFEVHGSSHPVHISSQFSAVVNAKNGDTSITDVAAHFNNTTVLASGQVTGVGNKTTELGIKVRQGRVEDLLRMFTKRDQPSMTGAISFEATVKIPPAPPNFLTRLLMEADVHIEEGRLTNVHAQQPLERLSASAEGEKKAQLDENAPHVEAHVRGHVSDAGGIAKLSNIQFDVPGIEGKMAGTFELQNKKVNIEGAMWTSGKLSDTTSGWKSMLLKVVSPVWKKTAKVEKVPFHITGNASHPVFALEFHH